MRYFTALVIFLFYGNAWGNLVFGFRSGTAHSETEVSPSLGLGLL